MALSREEQVELFKRIRAGDSDAEAELIERACGQTILSLSRCYENDRVSAEDLASEAVVALVPLARAFDPEARDVGFYAYSILRLRGAMLDALRRGAGSMIRVPPLEMKVATSISAFRDVFSQEHGREPLDVEVSASFGFAADDCTQVSRFRTYLGDAYSLDEDGGGNEDLDGNDISVLDCLASSEPLSDDVSVQREVQKSLSKALTRLTFNEESTVRAFFRIGVERAMSIEEIAVMQGASEQGVYWMKMSALKKLEFYLSGVYDDLQRNPVELLSGPDLRYR